MNDARVSSRTDERTTPGPSRIHEPPTTANYGRQKAQRSFRNMPADVVAAGFVVRAALALPDDVCATSLPAPSYFDTAAGHVPATATALAAVQQTAIELLTGFQGRDRATAALWMLATGRNTSCAMTAEAIAAVADACLPPDYSPQQLAPTVPSELAAAFVSGIELFDPAGADVARILAGARSRIRRMARAGSPTTPTAADFEVLHLFSGNETLWQLFANTASSRMWPARPGEVRAVRLTTLEELREAHTLASKFAPPELAVAATLAQDSPGTHSVHDALHIASLVVVGP